MAGLRLDIQEGATAARKNGTPVIPGNPDESLLIKRIESSDASFPMPPAFAHKTLTPDQKNVLRRWVAEGATWKQHWAFVPPVKQPLPAVKLGQWPRNEIDRFILAALESKGWQPAPAADRRTLIRRVTLDLTGLPPTPEEVRAFVNDRAANAYERVVDRLLASAHYGEHRARYWLDAARYADTNGLHFDNYREMWPYRDWVIRAFNSNLPFDRFTVQQLAGDLLPNATLDQKIASGFQRCNETTDEGGSILAEVEAMYAKDRADTTGTVWLGLTVGCATCHDHKFDPIPQKDYYALTSFFRNTTQTPMDMNIANTPPLLYVPPDADRLDWERLNAEIEKLQADLFARRNRAPAQIQEWLASLSTQTPLAPLFARDPRLDLTDRAAWLRGEARAELTLGNGVTLAGAPETGGKALAFDKNGTVTLPHVDEVRVDRPFTIAAWLYVPELKEDAVVAQQIQKSEGAKPGETKTRGWRISLDSGNLGIYHRAPAIYLFGEDGASISARAAPEVTFQEKAWHRVAFTYDGSRRSRGFTVYIDGAPVTTIGRVDDTELLSSTIESSAPLVFGSEKSPFDGGRIAGFSVLDRMADAEDARLLYGATVVQANARKPFDSLSESDRDRIALYYESTVDAPGKAQLQRLHDLEKAWYAIKSRSATTLVMRERTDHAPIAHVLYRGQYDQEREEVHPHALSVLPPMTEAMPNNRLGLAMWIVDGSNPLTARVTVNRFWQEVFGVGLVKTAEDFGSQGEPPVNPDLLDWLAVDFRDSGWNVKRLFKMFVMSAAYRQSAAATADKLAQDPENRLLSRGPRFRMDAEMVRDYALAASGLLQTRIGGPSAKPYQPPNIWEAVAMEQSNTRFYKPETGDGLYRRSLYTFWKRAAPPPSMDIFNAPSRETCAVRRERTNTPLQALVTMNDVQFVEAARALAQNAIASSPRLSKQFDFLSDRLMARPLAPEESRVLNRSYQDFLTYYMSAPEDAAKLSKVGASPVDGKLEAPKLAALTMVANEMLNLDEVLVK